MVEDHKFMIDRFERGFLKDEPEPAKSWGPLGRQMAAGLVAALLLVFGMLAAPVTSSARVAIGISVNFGPPPLPVYAQPPCPGPGYIWTPGYWAYAAGPGYYWVPGTWVMAPFTGALWTPGYWGYRSGLYVWFPGYWGTMVGFYGGIDYGFGYTGFGYHGGYWNRGRFYYNRAFNRLDGREFRHVYYRREAERFNDRRISFHGGPGGINVRPTRDQLAARRYRRFGRIRQQVRQEQFARSRPEQRWRVNRGRPGFAATPRPGEFRSFDRGQSSNRSRYSAPQGRTERRGFVRENSGHPVRAYNQQRNSYQARRGEQRGPQGYGGQERRGSSQRQDRGHGGNGHDHGRGGRR